MTKKMTNKEFKEALEKANISFDFWGYEGILNMIAILEKYQKKECLEKGFNASAKACERRRKAIFDILNERGYYDDV